jgi:hypothetical protein
MAISSDQGTSTHVDRKSTTMQLRAIVPVRKRDLVIVSTVASTVTPAQCRRENRMQWLSYSIDFEMERTATEGP